MLYGVEHDEAISIYALAMRARRLLRRPAPAGLLAMAIPRFFSDPFEDYLLTNQAIARH